MGSRCRQEMSVKDHDLGRAFGGETSMHDADPYSGGNLGEGEAMLLRSTGLQSGVFHLGKRMPERNGTVALSITRNTRKERAWQAHKLGSNLSGKHLAGK